MGLNHSSHRREHRQYSTFSCRGIVNVKIWLKAMQKKGPVWPEDTVSGVFIGPEVSHGATKVYAGVQA